MGMFKVSRREPDMPPVGKDDAEMSYRRGYKHGAVETFRAVERFLDPLRGRFCDCGFKKTFTDGGTRQCSAVRRFGA
jgi:hypothetical protein